MSPLIPVVEMVALENWQHSRSEQECHSYCVLCQLEMTRGLEQELLR